MELGHPGVGRDGLQRILDGLNPPQREAVEHRGGPLLVLAGAGSGKTRVITVRIAWLVDRWLGPEQVLALTFTNKAAGEMKERVAGLVGERAASALTVGTFHSLGLKMLEEDGKLIGIGRDFTLLDAADQNSALRSCLRALRLDPQRHDPGMFLSVISRYREAGRSPEDVVANPSERLMGRVYAEYDAWKKAHRALDFDDLILEPVRMLREVPEARDKWRDRFRTVLVDEYQDTNASQFQLVKLLADEHRSLCVVGDDDQSIYGWRGACIDNILGFDRHFPDARTVALTQNYRSTGHILACANRVIGHNSARKVKDLWTDRGDGPKVRVLTLKDGQAEAGFVAGRICRLRDELGLRWRDFGVLFRASSQAAPFEDAFRLAGVPYVLAGAFDFFQRKEVKDILSYLKLVVNRRDRASLIRVVNFPRRGLGPGALAALQAYADGKRKSPFRALADAHQIPRLTSSQREAMVRFHDLIDEAHDKYEAEGDLAGLVTWLCDATGAREAWIRDPAEGPGGQGRWASIEALVQSMRAYQAKRGRVELRDYLRLVALDKRTEGEDEDKDNAVSIMSMHASKGLEWPVCFVVGTEEGLMPHQRVLDERGDIAEERRLFYVAMTRARRHLFLTRARERKRFRGKAPSRPSRFLAEMPPEHFETEHRGSAGGEMTKDAQRARFEALRAKLAKR